MIIFHYFLFNILQIVGFLLLIIEIVLSLLVFFFTNYEDICACKLISLIAWSTSSTALKIAKKTLQILLRSQFSVVDAIASRDIVWWKVIMLYRYNKYIHGTKYNILFINNWYMRLWYQHFFNNIKYYLPNNATSVDAGKLKQYGLSVIFVYT